MPSKLTSAISEHLPSPSQGTQDADTHLKVAMYYLSKHDPKEITKTLEKNKDYK
jgi:hypothetical protein